MYICNRNEYAIRVISNNWGFNGQKYPLNGELLLFCDIALVAKIQLQLQKCAGQLLRFSTSTDAVWRIYSDTLCKKPGHLHRSGADVDAGSHISLADKQHNQMLMQLRDASGADDRRALRGAAPLNAPNTDYA